MDFQDFSDFSILGPKGDFPVLGRRRRLPLLSEIFDFRDFLEFLDFNDFWIFRILMIFRFWAPKGISRYLGAGGASPYLAKFRNFWISVIFGFSGFW